MRSLTERLNAKVVCVPDSSGAAGLRLINPDGPEAVVEIKGLRKRVEELEEALDPFARVAAISDAAGLNSPDDTPCRAFFPDIWPTLGDCRKARSALHRMGERRNERVR